MVGAALRGAKHGQQGTMEIRDAAPGDAPAGCTVLKRSIAELCDADHRNDLSILARWLGNKTVENFIAWIGQPDNSLLVAVEGSQILAVGSVTDAGTIGLNYVLPDARFRGVSVPIARSRSSRRRARKYPVHFDQHGNRSPFLSVDWLRRDWIAERRFRNKFRLPNEQATNLIRRLRLGPAGAKRRGCLGGRHVQFLQEVRDEFAADAWVLPLRVSWALQVIINAFDARRPVKRRWLVACQTLMTTGNEPGCAPRVR